MKIKILTLLIIILIAILLGSCKEDNITVQCTILNHSTTSTSIYYYTEVSCNDNEYRSLNGLGYFLLPINTKINYTYCRGYSLK